MFNSRSDAGKQLASKLSKFKNEGSIILALPRGGVPVAYEIAKELKSPFDVFVVRKIGAPYNPEYGIGAIAENNVLVWGSPIDDKNQIINKIVNKEKMELSRRVKVYRGNREFPELKDKVVILVDDGLATGITALAAVKGVKKLNPKKVIFTAPVCSFQSLQELKKHVDDIVCIISPKDLSSVGQYYKDFSQTTDHEVLSILNRQH